MTTLPEVQQQKTFKYLEEVETVAQDILTLKDEKLELSNAQNKLREALRALEQVEDRNSWITLGSVYVQKPTIECKALLREEIDKAEEHLKELHEEIRDKVHRLRDLEHEPRLEGFALKPMSLAEVKALHKGFGSL
ncbi:uncharacterized protein LOC115884961 [Sitophilus oryzae]|uniref:Uncharacterized protein LOC115884961 n=1 Tax=Sitophilus oryzae TaxID=7048 RepID=A0A6J2Y9E0_SITOR|nr:uncharacterized protein LOC115884961 [Sitophilus oryzae]